MITPCLCSGSLKYVHQDCLQRWIKSSDIKRCELCKFTFILQSKVGNILNINLIFLFQHQLLHQAKPLTEWETKKLCGSILIHLLGITCMILILYILIDRTSEEAKAQKLQWTFWLKLGVDVVGFVVGVVYLYIRCKVFNICTKWKAYSRTFVVQVIQTFI